MLLHTTPESVSERIESLSASWSDPGAFDESVVDSGGESGGACRLTAHARQRACQQGKSTGSTNNSLQQGHRSSSSILASPRESSRREKDSSRARLPSTSTYFSLTSTNRLLTLFQSLHSQLLLYFDHALSSFAILSNVPATLSCIFYDLSPATYLSFHAYNNIMLLRPTKITTRGNVPLFHSGKLEILFRWRLLDSFGTMIHHQNGVPSFLKVNHIRSGRSFRILSFFRLSFVHRLHVHHMRSIKVPTLHFSLIQFARDAQRNYCISYFFSTKPTQISIRFDLQITTAITPIYHLTKYVNLLFRFSFINTGTTNSPYDTHCETSPGWLTPDAVVPLRIVDAHCGSGTTFAIYHPAIIQNIHFLLLSRLFCIYSFAVPTNM